MYFEIEISLIDQINNCINAKLIQCGRALAIQNSNQEITVIFISYSNK